PTPAVDDLNPNHVFVTYARSTGTSEDIVVADSEDGAATFPRSVTVSSGAAARRFMPWLCATGGRAYATWYGQRTATSSDLTRYHFGSAWVQGGTLVSGADTDVSRVDAPLCPSGFPCGSHVVETAEACTVQPQLAGYCSGSGQLCDFSTPTCP